MKKKMKGIKTENENNRKLEKWKITYKATRKNWNVNERKMKEKMKEK